MTQIMLDFDKECQGQAVRGHGVAGMPGDRL